MDIYFLFNWQITKVYLFFFSLLTRQRQGRVCWITKDYWTITAYYHHRTQVHRSPDFDVIEHFYATQTFDDADNNK